MEDLTKRLINALRKAVTNARNADDAAEAAFLADALDAEGAPIPAATGAEAFANVPPAAPEPIREGDAQQAAPAPKKSKS